MEYLVIICLIALVVFIMIYNGRLEKMRYREFVKSVKAKDIDKYEEVTIDPTPLEEEIKDEIMELEEVAPEQLINKLK